jgi:hypothetical protein
MPLDVKQICDIIKLGSKLGLARLEYEGLKLEFRADDDPQAPVQGQRGPKLTKKQAAALQQENEASALADQEFKTREEQLAHLLIADPVAYEELIARGELEHAGEKSERPQA